MLPTNVQEFVTKNHLASFSTLRGNGGMQLSLVLAGPFQEGAAFSTPGDRAKYKNLLRNPKCSLLVSTRDWFSGYVVLEGQARVMDASNTEPAALSSALRDVYRATADAEHPDWEEFDQAMRDERRAVIVVVPESIYGTAV
ncbi:MAG: Pyridoxamine 5'-phosphate oxidase [Chloroflexi bacterium]|jgi:PPOX class probable F420-dependent enzyme|nr:MAG: Pyridoxamine 5'-phosphate oxidase [Chloroflexota bacterium]